MVPRQSDRPHLVLGALDHHVHHHVHATIREEGLGRVGWHIQFPTVQRARVDYDVPRGRPRPQVVRLVANDRVSFFCSSDDASDTLHPTPAPGSDPSSPSTHTPACTWSEETAASGAPRRGQKGRRVAEHMVEALEEGPGPAVGVDGWRTGRKRKRL
jgi:hypothetical protein